MTSNKKELLQEMVEVFSDATKFQKKLKEFKGRIENVDKRLALDIDGILNGIEQLVDSCCTRTEACLHKDEDMEKIIKRLDRKESGEDTLSPDFMIHSVNHKNGRLDDEIEALRTAVNLAEDSLFYYIIPEVKGTC